MKLSIMQIKEALKILAEAKDNQIAYLEDLGTSPSTDELALQFDDTYQVFKGYLGDQFGDILCKKRILKKLDSISLIFDEMSAIPNNSFWNISSLDNKEWANIRKIAVETLPLILDLDV